MKITVWSWFIVAVSSRHKLTAVLCGAGAVVLLCVNVGQQGLGPVRAIGHGSANVIVTDVFLASNATLTSEDGNIIGVIAGVGIADILTVDVTGSGAVYFDSFVMATGVAAYVPRSVTCAALRSTGLAHDSGVL